MYDMDGLAMYDDGMGQMMITPEMLRVHAMAGGAGAGGILLTSAIVQRLPLPETWSEPAKRYTKIAVSALVGVFGGNYLYRYNRDAAMGFVGGVLGLALAQLVEGFAVTADGTRYLTTSLAAPYVSEADLASLDAAVAQTSQAYNQRPMPALQGTQVTSRELQAAGVTREVLGEYAPYLS